MLPGPQNLKMYNLMLNLHCWVRLKNFWEKEARCTWTPHIAFGFVILDSLTLCISATEFTFLSNAKLHGEMAQVKMIRLRCLFKMCLLLEEVSIWQCYFNFMIASYNMMEQKSGRIFYR